MFRGILLQVSRNMRSMVCLQQSEGMHFKCDSVLTKRPLAPELSVAAHQLFGGQQSIIVRDFHRNCLLSFCNSPQVRQDPCKGGNDCHQEQEQEEEEEEFTITPCCKPFRLQKEHPMMKEKRADCKKEGQEEKKPTDTKQK